MNTKEKSIGNFLISLDFELHWGVFENNPKDYDLLFESTRKGILRTLELFKKYDIHATWATVGMLFAATKEELLEFAPKLKPNYSNLNLSSYNILNKVGADENEDKSHFANELIQKIKKTPCQELGSHTFSHYFACEEGQNLAAFKADCTAIEKIALKNQVTLNSLVFPRNQVNSKYLSYLFSKGILTVRTNPDKWFYNSSQSAEKFNSTKYKLMRALDLILPLSKTSFGEIRPSKDVPLMIPASRFLRPYKKQDYFLNALKSQRIKKEMLSAAKNNRNYHLWWHPHNFGNELEENLEYLESILLHYTKLKAKYGFQSKNMKEFYDSCQANES